MEIESTIIDGCQTPQVCVAECPNVTFSVQPNPSTEARLEELKYAVCLYGTTPTPDTVIERRIYLTSV